MGSANFNSGCEVRIIQHYFSFQKSSSDNSVESRYLETDDVGSYEHPDALEEISQSVNERCPDNEAALLPLQLPGR